MPGLVTVRTAAAMLILNAAVVAVAPAASVTVTVMLLVVPAALGVPEITPVEAFRVRPAGSVVEVKVFVPLPPALDI